MIPRLRTTRLDAAKEHDGVDDPGRARDWIVEAADSFERGCIRVWDHGRGEVAVRTRHAKQERLRVRHWSVPPHSADDSPRGRGIERTGKSRDRPLRFGGR